MREIPPEWAHLHVDPHRGLPVPFFAPPRPDGTAVFSAVSPARAYAAGRHRLCGICALAQGGAVALLGDPGAVWYTDPPMHERCAELTLDWCPFIAAGRVPRRDLPGDVTAAAPAGWAPGTAKDQWLMVITAGYGMARAGGGFVFRAGPVARVRLFGYDRAGRLAELAR